MQSGYTIVCVLGFLYIVRRVLELRRKIAAVDGDYPGFRMFFGRPTFLGNAIPKRIPWFTMSVEYYKRRLRQDFDRFGWDICSCINIWPWQPYFLVCDAAAVKEVTGLRNRFGKPIWQYGVLLQFGSNVVSTDGDEWKRHRKPANPAFSESNNKYVCEEAVRAMFGLFDEWKDRDVIKIEKFQEIALEFTILVIGSAGFGRIMSKEENNRIPPGHTMSFVEALRIMSSDIIFKAVLPNWVMNLSERLRKANQGYVEFYNYLEEMIEARRVAGKGGKQDLFSLLLEANEADDDPQSKLNDSELMGNMFIFLFAGHETSAHTLAFAIGRLAVHQDEQEELYQHIKKVLPNNEVPTYEKLNMLTQSLAVLYETLRLHPSVVAVPKVAIEDTSLTVGGSCGKTRAVAMPKGTCVDIIVAALHTNPRYWKDPLEFRPSRFNEDWPRDAFIPYSSGARSCIGRRFNETESVVFITMLVQRYKIEVLEEPQFAHETFEQRRERVVAGKQVITWTPDRVPVVLTRRK